MTPLVIVDGRVGGTWEIGGGKKGVVEVIPWGRWRGGVREETKAEVERVAACPGRPLTVEFGAPVVAAG